MLCRRYLLSTLNPVKPCVVRLGETIRNFASDRTTREKSAAWRYQQRRRRRQKPSAAYQQVIDVLEKSKKQPQKLSEQTHVNPVGRILAGAKADSAKYPDADLTEGQEGRPPRDETAASPLGVSSTYEDLIKYVVGMNKFHRKHSMRPHPDEMLQPLIDYLLKEEPIGIEIQLPTLDQALGRTETRKSTAKPHILQKQLSIEFAEQKDRFIEANGWTKLQYSTFQGALFHAARACAKYALGAPAELLWLKAKEAGALDQKFLQTLLHVASVYSPPNRQKRAIMGKYSGSKSSILEILDGDETSEDSSRKNDLIDIIDELAVTHDLKYQPTEQTLIVRSRLLIAMGQGEEAEELLDRHAAKVRLHLRTYLPLLRFYLDQGNIGPSLRVIRKMLESDSVILDTDTYVQVIAGLAEHGVFRPSTPPFNNVAGPVVPGSSSTSGPQLLNDLLEMMMEQVREIPTVSARRLYNAFAEGFPDAGLEKLAPLSPLEIKQHPVREDEKVVADLVPINPYTGRCERTGVSLHLSPLTDEQVEKLKNAMYKVAGQRQSHLVASYRRQGADLIPKLDAPGKLQGFLRWLDTREGEPFTVVVDGANVAYHGQNFEGGRFNYHQLQFMIDSLEELGERPLIVLPRKYALDFFYIPVSKPIGEGTWRQRLSSAERRIRTNLMDSGKVAVVPPGTLDDYYWILASVAKQTKARKGRDLTVPVDDESGRWPGPRPHLISNDQMKDHKLAMLEPMLFRRWYSNHIVNFNFPAFYGSECMDKNIGFSPADTFSREIQYNKAADGTDVWHFPISDQQDVWFCLSLRYKTNE